MKVLISADMEGTSGVVNWVQVIPPEIARAGMAGSTSEYERARRRMTLEVNAAIEGALAAGADDVLVNDSHDGMRNLIPDELHPAARFISGFDKLLLMVQGADEDGVEGLLYTGYHARAGTPDGPLAHSFTGWVHDIRVDGTSMGEYGVNALIAGHFNVPVIFVSGDNRAVEQTQELLGEQVVGAVTKRGYSVTSALNEHPTRAQEAIRTGAERAVRQLKDATPYRLKSNATVEIDFDHQSRAAQAEQIPGVERTAWRTISLQPTDGLELARYMRSILTAAGSLAG